MSPRSVSRVAPLAPTRLLALLVALLVTLGAALAQAQGQAETGAGGGGQSTSPAAPTVEVFAAPLFGDGSIANSAWGEVLVRIVNNGKQPARGKVSLYGSIASWSGETHNESFAPYVVSPGASVSMLLPVRAGRNDDPVLHVYAEDDKLIHKQEFSRSNDNRSILVNVAKASVLSLHLNNVAIGSRNEPWVVFRSRGRTSVSSPTAAFVVAPMFDHLSSDPQLPRRTAGYARIAALLIRSDDLVGLGAAELEALSGWLLAGGTLAIVVARPEDTRHGLLVSLLGNEARRTAVAVETTRFLTLATPSFSSRYGSAVAQPRDKAPSQELSSSLRGYAGGNLRPSPYGASAPYGLGEVHLLAFDPQKRPAVDESWTHVRMLDLLRRANERFSSVLFRQGGVHVVADHVRSQLDPNEGSRWAIILSALLLCAYSVVAGPVNFTRWRKKGKPLYALITLPIASAIAFAAVVIVGVKAKGCSGRARHLTVVEAGAGMKVGTARRWRGFFVPSARALTVHATSPASVLAVDMPTYSEEGKDHLLIDRGGLRLVRFQLRPWQTEVVREDGFASLGDGISLSPSGSGEVSVSNRSGRDLRGVVLWLPTGETRFRERIENGATVQSGAFKKVSAHHRLGGGRGLRYQELAPNRIEDELENASEGLTKAWLAAQRSIAWKRDWFPDDVPVLLAMLDGGEGQSEDTGLRIDSDRVLVRIVGYGGKP